MGAALHVTVNLPSGSLGGLYCGGFGGIGSINYGPLAAPGNVLSVKVMTVEASPCVDYSGSAGAAATPRLRQQRHYS